MKRPEGTMKNFRSIPPCLPARNQFVRSNQPLRSWLISGVAPRQKSVFICVHPWLNTFHRIGRRFHKFADAPDQKSLPANLRTGKTSSASAVRRDLFVESQLLC
jgi:hypothetical protein